MMLAHVHYQFSYLEVIFLELNIFFLYHILTIYLKKNGQGNEQNSNELH